MKLGRGMMVNLRGLKKANESEYNQNTLTPCMKFSKSLYKYIKIYVNNHSIVCTSQEMETTQYPSTDEQIKNTQYRTLKMSQS